MAHRILKRTVQLGLVHAVALAVTATMAATPDPGQRPAGDAAAPAPTAKARTDSAPDVVRSFRDIRASRLIGMRVRSPSNEVMGQVKDVILDLGASRAQYAVLEFEGEFFVTKKLFVYPLSSFKPSADGEHLVLAVEKGKLAEAPGFASDRWPTWHGKYAREIDRHFGIDPRSDEKGEARLVRASRYLGRDVHDAKGKDIGELFDLVVNLKSGEVHYAVVAFDKPWSVGDKLVAIPLNAFEVAGGKRGELRVNVPRETVARAPGMTRGEWRRSDVNNDAWVGEVDRYALSIRPSRQSSASGAMRADAQAQPGRRQ